MGEQLIIFLYLNLILCKDKGGFICIGLDTIIRAEQIFSDEDYNRYMRTRCNDSCNESVIDLIYILILDSLGEAQQPNRI